MTSRNPHRPSRSRMFAVMAALFPVLCAYAGNASGQGYYPGPIPPMPVPPQPAPAPPATSSVYAQTSLVSNGAVPGAAVDPNLINPWGMARAPDGPMWVVNNATQTATVYDGAGSRLPILVSLPGGVNGPAAATGLVFNGTDDFMVSNGIVSAAATFLFDGEGGTILAWTAVVDAANAIIVHDDGVGGAVYKGLALAGSGNANFLYATDFHNGKVDVFDAQFQKVAAPGGFTDATLPQGYAPFGIQAIELGGQTVIVVTYAQRAPDSDEDVAGPGLGLVNVFDTQGVLLRHLVPVGSNLNAPWGVALAPANFGALANTLLIGNFGDGVINAYEPLTGAFVGTIRDAAGQPLVNEGLWGLAFGNDTNNQPADTLYFTAGIAQEAAGLYGRIDLRQ